MKITMTALLAVIALMDKKDGDLWLNDRRPDLESLRDAAEDDTITSAERDQAWEAYEVTPSEEAEEGVTTLIAKTLVDVAEGEVQSCWGSLFTGTEIDNPDFDEEFGEEDEKRVMALVGKFPNVVEVDGKEVANHEIESLLRAKRAVRFKG